MQTVKSGDKVKVHYHGRLTNGTSFDSSEGRQPLEFTVGSGMVIVGFDNGVKGMKVGDKKTIEIPVHEAYGPKDPKMLLDFPIDRFPESIQPAVGLQLYMNDNSGQQFPVVVKELKGDTVILDANHPLAGEDLIFDLELVEIVGGSLIIT
jgi:peptidylprolyl isomerase